MVQYHARVCIPMVFEKVHENYVDIILYFYLKATLLKVGSRNPYGSLKHSQGVSNSNFAIVVDITADHYQRYYT